MIYCILISLSSAETGLVQLNMNKTSSGHRPSQTLSVGSDADCVGPEFLVKAKNIEPGKKNRE